MQLKEAIKSRKSVTRYHHKKPDWRKIVQAIDAVRYAPNADGTFAMKWILVSDEKKIEEICKATQQDFVRSAKYVVVAVSDDSKLVQLYKEGGTRYSMLQAGAAIQNFLLELTEKKLVTKWVKYFYEDEIKRALEIPEKMQIDGVFPIGIETKIKTKEEYKKDLENYLFFEKWGEKKMEPQTRVKLETV